MPADPASLAVGLGGILLAFKSVVDTVNLFDLIVTKDNGSKHLALRYYVERHKTTIWGDEFQPDDGLHSPLLQETNATRRLIAGVLSEMLATHHQAEKFLQRYQMEEPAQPAGVDRGSPIGMTSSFVTKVKEVRDTHVQRNTFTWATKDKQKFTEIVERMGSLNADLRELVRGNSTQTLAAAISSSLLPQLKESLSLVALQQTESIDPLLKLSARLKELQNASERQVGTNVSILDFRTVFKDRAALPKNKKSIGVFQQGSGPELQAWVEWRVVAKELNNEDRGLVTARIEALSIMLSVANDPKFHIPPCQGLVEDAEYPAIEGRKLGFVLTPPSKQEMPKAGPQSLLDLFAEFESCPPLLNDRFELAYKLASVMSLMHASKWIHKGFRSENILFCNTGHGRIDVTKPLVSGFEYSRPESQISLRDRPTGVPEIDLYYHPDVPLRGFNRVRDCYSLSVVLLEVAMWRPMHEIIPESTGKQLGDMTMSEYRAFFLDSMAVLGSTMGASYRDAVRVCLTGDFGVVDQNDGSALGRAFFTKVLQKLNYCRA